MAVTAGPGLIGALLVGLSAAKAIAAPRRLPLIPTDHLHGHVAANFLAPDPLEPPFLCLVASGGHTLLAAVRDPRGFEVLGETLDDAAGEAIDKGARQLGLGFPGGPALQRLAEDGDPGSLRVPGGDDPRPGTRLQLQRPEDGAGLPLPRTRRAGRRARTGPTSPPATRRRSSTSSCRSSSRALDREEWPAVALGGGVAANGPLRQAVSELCEERGIRLKLVPISLCTDNAAMIAAAAAHTEPIAWPGYLDFDAFATGGRQ